MATDYQIGVVARQVEVALNHRDWRRAMRVLLYWRRELKINDGTDLDATGLSGRTILKLNLAAIFTVEQLQEYKPAEIAAIRGIGAGKSLLEILDVLRNFKS